VKNRFPQQERPVADSTNEVTSKLLPDTGLRAQSSVPSFYGAA